MYHYGLLEELPSAVTPTHPVGKITRLGYTGYGVRRAGSFAGRIVIWFVILLELFR